MLLQLIQLLAARHETAYNQGRNEFAAEMLDGEIVLVPAEEAEEALAKTKLGAALLAQFEIEYHRFKNKTTVVHVYHIPTDTAYLGRSFSPTSAGFHRKKGQELALRDALRQFLINESYRLKWLAHASSTPLKT